MSTPYISLADFASTFHEQREAIPAWVHPDSITPLPLHQLGVRHRIEDVLDTVVALQRAEWLQDGVYVGPQAVSEVYADVLHCARKLHIAVPPAVLSSGVIKRQAAHGTDSRAFLHLSSFYFATASEPERRFVAGRLCGHIAANQVTANTLYALVVDTHGLRSMARRAVGPVFEVFLAPLGLGMRLALSRWHRAAEISADRAGLLCAGSLYEAERALLRMALAIRPNIDPEVYLDQIRAQGGSESPGRFAELLSDEPWMHKRMKAMEIFTRSAVYAELTGTEVPDAISSEDLNKQTTALLGVS